MKIWEPKPPGTLWATPGLLRDSFNYRHSSLSRVSWIQFNALPEPTFRILDPSYILYSIFSIPVSLPPNLPMLLSALLFFKHPLNDKVRGPQTGLDVSEKRVTSRHWLDSNPGSFIPCSSYYFDYTIPLPAWTLSRRTLFFHSSSVWARVQLATPALVANFDPRQYIYDMIYIY